MHIEKYLFDDDINKKYNDEKICSNHYFKSVN